jgi:hypothetical protein
VEEIDPSFVAQRFIVPERFGKITIEAWGDCSCSRFTGDIGHVVKTICLWSEAFEILGMRYVTTTYTFYVKLA